jgi:hypothetical protein
MIEIEHLSKYIEWIDSSFVERRRTPEWEAQVGIRCHLAGISMRYKIFFSIIWKVNRSHVAVHNRVHNAYLEPVSTVNGDQVMVDKKEIQINSDSYWPYDVVDAETNEILQLSCSQQ